MAAGLLGIGALVYGPYTLHAGYFWDDWTFLARYRLGHPGGFWATVEALHAHLGGRPVLSLALAVLDVLGDHPVRQAVLAVVLAILTSLCLYLLLRALSLRPPPASAIAVLALLFPWSDSLRFWATASVTNLSLCFLFLGTFVALQGLGRRGRSQAMWHAGAVALYLLSVLTYEATGATALLAGLLYLKRAPRTRVARLWATDAVVILGGLLYSLLATSGARHVGSVSARAHDVPTFIKQAGNLLAQALVPLSLPAAGQLLELAAIAALGVLTALRLRHGFRTPARGWVGLLAIGGLTIAAAYFMFLGSSLYPLSPGLDNRTNILAGVGYSVVTYSIVAVACTSVTRNTRLATNTALALVALIAVGWALQLRRDERHWQHAALLQRGVLSAVRAALPVIPSGSKILTFGVAGESAPEVVVFDKAYDLGSALQLQARDLRIQAYPIVAGVRTTCGPASVDVVGPGDYGVFTVRYRRVFFVDVSDQRSAPVASRKTCLAALRATRP
ncbi:MAG TPA: hypothetical protein VG405_11575 [Solirubrobacteraceae bacterium]|jgi:hypothetical protein|nr:hypothetical protein [Solirubrobacteraceae bacterium]